MSEQDRAGMPPLSGIRVVELCTTIAGPACARLLADFGADVIKIEPPAGDPVRQMGYHAEGVALYPATLFRGKRSIALDLKRPECVEAAAALIERADIVVENFRPGVLERLGLGYEAMSARNPGLVMVRISGYGQTGPYAQRPGYGAICEAFAGVRHMTGDPDRPPARVALPATDYLSSVLGAYGAMVAIHERSRSGRGQVVDLALYEAAFTQMEQVVPAYEQLGIVPTRQGPNLASMAPNSLYPTLDSQYMLIAANNQAIWERLRAVMDVPGLAEDPRFASIRERGRPENVHALNEIVSRWTASLDADALEAILRCAEVPSSRVNTIADIYRDEHFKAREMLLRVPHPTLGHTTQMGVIPKLTSTPGRVSTTGPEVGQHTREVLSGVLGWSASEIEQLLVAVADEGVRGRTEVG